MCFFDHDGGGFFFATTESLLCLSYSSKYFFFSFSSEIGAEVKEGGDIPAWFLHGQTPLWPSGGRHTLLPGRPAAGPNLLEEPGRYAQRQNPLSTSLRPSITKARVQPVL